MNPATTGIAGQAVELFSTSPLSTGTDRQSCLQEIIKVARWSEAAGCTGILVYADNSLPDPWLVSQVILANTERLCPLPAIQPVYMHPFSVAKAISTLATFYGRRLCLNMIAGGFANDLAALNDTTPHDKRYARLVEYTSIIKELLAGEPSVTYTGEFYRVEKLRLMPPLPPELFPQIFMSGSSEAGIAAARATGATAVKYPKPAGVEMAVPGDTMSWGIRVGIITRETEEEAWRVAHSRFPVDRKGELTHKLAMKTSDSVWHKELSEIDTTAEDSPYWLVPFQNYKTFCPYLVGSYDCVASEVKKYLADGYRTFIVDIPASEEELFHITSVFQQAQKQASV